jgi:hypothetical protein
MGISIHTIVDPKCISRSAWQRVYDETVTVLRNWPDPPIRPRYREIAGVELVVYSREVVAPDGWHICGDANSRLTAESIELSRALGVADPRDPPSDLLLRVLATQEPPYGRNGLRWLLDNKTQNKPFHSLVLAIAMLIEHRLPHAALAGGDFTPEQAQEAQTRLQAILGEVVPLPLAADLPRLRARLEPHLHGVALYEAVQALSSRGTLAAVFISLLSGSFGTRPHQEIEEAVSCTDVSTLDDLTREAFDLLMAQSKALFGPPAPVDPPDPASCSAFPADLVELDARGLLEVIACGTKTTDLRLTEMAWEDIQRATLPELHLLAMLATHPTSGLIAHQLRLAVFESAAIRRFCLEAWDTTEPVNPLEMPIQARLFDEACAA